MSWSWEFAFKVFPDIASAIWLVIGITFGSYIVSLILGLLLTFLRRSSLKPISLSTYGLIEFVRSTPPLVQLFFVFYALPHIGISLNMYVAGIMTLGVHYSTYISEVYRSGIENVPKGQWEAARALNLSKFKTWFKIILPQSIPPVIPMLGNYLLVLFKETPLLMAIGIGDFLQRAQLIGAAEFKYLEPITIVGILFLLLSYPSALAINRLEKWSNQAFSGKGRKRKDNQNVKQTTSSSL